jgi:mono/diheme cytochrome c family protein
MTIAAGRMLAGVLIVLGAQVFFGLPLFPSPGGKSGGGATLEEGKYLVESVTICFECHSERDFSQPGWPIPPGRAGSGRILWGEGSPNQVVASNITPDKSTGIGTWSDEEIIRAIRDGVGKNGRVLNPEMPSRYFRSLDDVELRSIVMYLRTIPPVSNRLPEMAKYVPGKHPPAIAMDKIRLTKESSKVKRGEHLVRLAGCETCHTPNNEDGFIRGLEFAGGKVFSHGEQSAATPNLTPDPSGISYYDEERFIAVVRTGKVGAREINSAMPWYFYRHLTDADLKAIFAYLQALPPVKHQVDNSEPPTKCAKCGFVHGLGDRN